MTEPGRGAGESAWRKLRHRKVVQWGFGYVAVAWGLLQGLEFAVATFQWPEVITRVGAVVAAIGLPITILLAWFHGDRGEQKFTRTECLLLALLLVAGAFAVRQQLVRQPAAPAVGTPPAASVALPAIDRHRLAILPFANLGNDPANTAFVSGVHDTLITQIAKVPGLSVISRSSVLQFEGKQPTIREVAAALHVGAVLEGSVARDGNRLRVQAQLIDATSDEHLWAETYDRTAGDLFAVQSEISQAVAEQLRIRLTSSDTQRLKAGLTRNPAAYERYVVGRSHASSGQWSEAIEALAQAVALDPGFAAAHAQLSMAYLWRGFEDSRQRATTLPLARSEADRALELDPTLPEAHMAQAVYLYRGSPDIDRAAIEFERAIAGLPNDAEAHLTFGFLRRWQGRFEEGAALLERAAALDPHGRAPSSAARSLAGLGRREDAMRVIAAGLAAQPENADLFVLPGNLAGDIDCDLGASEIVLAEARRRFPDSAEVRREEWYLAWQTGNFAAALTAAEQYAALTTRDDDSTKWRLGVAKLAAGQPAEGRALLQDSLKPLLEKLESLPAGDQKADQLAWTAIHYSQLGDDARALDYARRSLLEFPVSGARLQRALTMLLAASVIGRAGDVPLAMTYLREALSTPLPNGASGLWCDPLLAPLRADARFRSFIAELGGNASIDPERRETWPKPSPVWLATSQATPAAGNRP